MTYSPTIERVLREIGVYQPPPKPERPVPPGPALEPVNAIRLYIGLLNTKPDPKPLPLHPAQAVAGVRHTNADGTIRRADDILADVCEVYGIKAIRGRDHTATAARTAACVLLRKQRRSFHEIGDLIGGANHSTVISACNRFARLSPAPAKEGARE